MSTLAVVEEILRETQEPMSVRQIVVYAADRLPTRSKTPDTVVARDLSVDIKREGEGSRFVRTAPGRFTLRELLPLIGAVPMPAPAPVMAPAPTAGDAAPTPVLSAALKSERAALISSVGTRSDDQSRSGRG